MVRDVPCLKSLTRAPHFKFSSEKLTAAFCGTRLSPLAQNSDKHFAEEAKFRRVFRMQSAAESCLVLILLQPAPDHADSWAHFKARRHRDEGSLSPDFGHHLEKFAVCRYVICFVPAEGISTLGLDLSSCVRLCTFYLLCIMSCESPGSLVNVSST